MYAPESVVPLSSHVHLLQTDQNCMGDPTMQSSRCTCLQAVAFNNPKELKSRVREALIPSLDDVVAAQKKTRNLYF